MKEDVVMGNEVWCVVYGKIGLKPRCAIHCVIPLLADGSENEDRGLSILNRNCEYLYPSVVVH